MGNECGAEGLSSHGASVLWVLWEDVFEGASPEINRKKILDRDHKCKGPVASKSWENWGTLKSSVTGTLSG